VSLPIPCDSEAEENVVGCVAGSKCGSELAHQRLVGRDFYDPRCGRAFSAAVRPEVVQAEAAARPGEGYFARVRTIAELADVDLCWLEDCAANRPSFADVAGVSAARVVDAARRRRIMRLAADLHEAAAHGDDGHLTRLLVEAGHAA
jgi:replicative DNA helicase